MRAPKRKRRRIRTIHVEPGVDLDKLAERVRYEGSAEHKDYHSFAGSPRLRSDATPCPPEVKDPKMVCAWLRSAIRRGATGELWEGDFPRYIWYKRGNVVYEGRLVNRGLGSYKGYELEQDEWPENIDEFYGRT